MIKIKDIIKKLQKPRFIRAGSCKKCGVCCRNITFKIQDKFVTEIEEFERLKSWQKRYNHFFISGKDDTGTLLFTCKSLGDDNLCKSYHLRSLHCRLYPEVRPDFIASGGETLDGCGYYFKSSIEFKTLLD